MLTRPLTEILRGRLFVPRFQPIVRLPEAMVHGYEALISGPEKSCLETPEQLFSAARGISELPVP